MKKIRIGRKIILVPLLILITFITATYVLSKQNNSEELEDNINVEYTKEKLEDIAIKVKQVKECISKNVEIIVLQEKGNIEIFNDKTPKNNKYIEWIIDSNITLKVDYTAVLTIDSESIKINYNVNEDKVNITYKQDDIKIKLVNIDNILSKTEKGIFGRKYSEEEVTALTILATDKVKENISNDIILKEKATINLQEYLNNILCKIGITNFDIIQE